jgi:hypothetical protein
MILVGVLMLLAIAGTVFGQPAISSVTITLSAEGMVAPETIPAGWVEITFENTAEAPLFGIMARLDEDATMDDFMGALMGMMGGDAGIVPPATFTGAPAAMPGTLQRVTYNLAAGTYILLNVAGEEPQIATFVVEGEVAEGDFEPEADLIIPLVDFAFGLPAELPAGEQTWLIENIGEQWHEMIFIPVPDGTTLEDAMMLMMAVEEGAEGDGGMPEFAAVWSPMSAGEKAWMTVDLAPGTYLVSCFIPDVNSDEHAIHAALGMIQIVTVTDTVTYTDPAGFFTLDYPAELAAVRPDLARTFGFPFPSVGLADSDETTGLSSVGQPVPEGGWGIGLMFIPEAFLLQMGMPADASLSDLAMVFAPQPGNAEGSEVVSVREITLADGTAAIEFTTAGVTEDGVTLFYEVTDGVYVLAALLLSPGGRTDAMVEAFMKTVESIEFTGTLEDIMAGMGGE